MAYKILWAPIRWPNDRHIERDSVGPHCQAEFADDQNDITDTQWASCDAIVSLLDIPEPYRRIAAKCRIFVTPKVGYDNIDLHAWGALGIPVCNVPDYGTMEVADHAIALMLSLLRCITFHNEEIKADPVGNWKPTVNPFTKRLSVCKLGIVGIGRIGMATALRAKAFGMDVCFYDPYVENGRDKALGIRRVNSLNELFSQCDVVSLHVPLNSETHNLISTEVLSYGHNRLVLVNTARGPVIDLDALHVALKNDTVMAVGLDVLPQEPADPSHPLIKAWAAGETWIKHRIVLTPHSAFNTPQSIHDMRHSGGATAAKYLTSQVLENCVNTEYLV